MTKKTWRWFVPWQFKKELELVNERSEDGFHLVGASQISRTEEVDESVVYRYLLDCRQKHGVTEMFYEKQGWELVCAQGAWLWFRKKWEEDRQETEYELHGDPGPAIADHLHRLIAPLDVIRNILLVLTFIALLIPSELTNNITPRLGGFILLADVPVIWVAEQMRKALGEDKRK